MRTLIAILTLCGSTATAQTCGSHIQVVDYLAENYGETRQTIALSSNNMVVETYANLDTGSWTLLGTMPGQQTCLLASGEVFEITPTPPTVGEEG